MIRHPNTLISLITLSALSGWTLAGCTLDVGAQSDELTCPTQTCTDNADLDGDGALDCEDTDVDGDGLRNIWDASPSDPTNADILPGGLGTDGALSLNEISAQSVTRTLLVGAAAAGATSLHVERGADFAEGEEILILSVQGQGAGAHFSAYVASASDDTLVIEPPLAEDISGDVVLVQRVPNYTTVNIGKNGQLVAEAWDGVGGGVLAFRAMGAIEILGSVRADGAGFTGAESVSSYLDRPYQGESWVGLGEDADLTLGAANQGGGGAAYVVEDEIGPAASGAGGGYGSDGGSGLFENDAEASAEGGLSYGDATLMSWFYGSGGGAGAHDYAGIDGQREGNLSGGGGAGGGIVFLFSETSVLVSGTVSADGEAGQDAVSVGAELGGGGGGSGGQIQIGAPVVSIDDTVSAIGGSGGSAARSTSDGKDTELVCERADTSECVSGRGGAGGDGRIRFDVADDSDAGTNPGGTVRPEPIVVRWQEPERFPCDRDGDGVISAACGLPGVTADCDDLRADVFPGAPEVEGDGIDQDCDPGTDACDPAPGESLSVYHGG